ncbi:MAG: MFS transporter [Candidatus Promineifilaceae bacterium]|nr:MFS transporter [Candidatus Promineifilaceae bacterium]
MSAESTGQPRGMRAFTIVWAGQLVSLLGTNMTGFALPIYIYGQTERVRELALLGLAFTLPLILLSPFSGAIVDRANRKLMMMISDLAAGLMTIVILILVLTDSLQIWHLFVTAVVSGTFQSFQWPAYSAAISVMLPKKHYARAHGMISLAQSGSNIFAPLLAGAVLGVAGLRLVLLIDIVTFLFAIGSLALVHIPTPPPSEEGQEGAGSLWSEAAYGFRYIWRRPSLLGLQTVFLVGNFLVSLSYTTVAAMILARTNQNELLFGTVQSAGAVGGVAGALLMSAWGGPKRLIHGVLGGWFVSSLLGPMLLGIGQGLPVWAAASFFAGFFIPIINGSNQAIWQAKVAPDIQGRVFSIRRLIAWLVNPVATLLAIPLADNILEPAMQPGGALVEQLSWLVGSGPGAGMALIFIGSGILASLAGLSGYLIPAIRNVETILPDHALAQESDTQDRVAGEEMSAAPEGAGLD